MAYTFTTGAAGSACGSLTGTYANTSQWDKTIAHCLPSPRRTGHIEDGKLISFSECVAGGFLFDKFADHGFMLIFFIVFIMGAGQALLTSAGYVWLLFVDVYIVGVMFGALHGGKGEGTLD